MALVRTEAYKMCAGARNPSPPPRIVFVFQQRHLDLLRISLYNLLLQQIAFGWSLS